MSQRSPLTRRLLRPLLRQGKALAHRDDGVTLIEFGILAMPFFMIVAAILETAVVFLASQFLDSATQDATRTVLTGQAYASNFTLANFRTSVCNGLYGLFDCTKLKIKVTAVTNFSTAAVDTPWNTDQTDKPNWENYACTSGNSVVMVQVYYKWPIVLNFPAIGLADQSDGTRTMSAVRVFANEPFSGSC